MVETKNPAIKLFGMRIKVLPSPDGVPPPTSPVADSVEEEDDVETEQVQLSHELALFCESEGYPFAGVGREQLGQSQIFSLRFNLHLGGCSENCF